MSDIVDEAGLIDIDALSRSVNGFEQIAIRQFFRDRLDVLAEDGPMFMRAMLFVLDKRDGMADPDAYRKVMLLELDDVVSRFDRPEAVTEDDDAVAERDASYADFVIGTGLSFTVDEYMRLTVGQKAAIIERANRR